MARNQPPALTIEELEEEDGILNSGSEVAAGKAKPQTYPVTLRLYQTGQNGESEYHVDLTVRKIRALIERKEHWVVLPDRYSLPSYSEARLLSIENISELHIVGVSSDMKWLYPDRKEPF